MKTIGTNITYATRLFLSLCVCVSTGLIATGSQDAAIANGILKALTPPAGTETNSLLQAVSGAKEVHFHVGNNSQPAQPQPQTVQHPTHRSFAAEFIIHNPGLAIGTVGLIMAGTTYFVHSKLRQAKNNARVETGNTLRLFLDQHNQQLLQSRASQQSLDQANANIAAAQTVLGALQAGQIQQGEGLRQQRQTLAEVQTGVGVLQTGQIRQGELLTSQAQTMNSIQGTQAEQGRTLQSLATTVTEGFQASAANQQRNDATNQAMRSQMGTLGEEQRAHAQQTTKSFAQLFAQQKEQEQQAAQRATQSQLWKNSLEKQVQDIAGNNAQARQTLEGILTRTGELESTVSSIKHSQQTQGQQLSTMGEQLTNQSRQLNQVLAGQEKTNAHMARLNHQAKNLNNLLKTPMLETLVTRARTKNKTLRHKKHIQSPLAINLRSPSLVN